jgi:hypothetical protein
MLIFTSVFLATPILPATLDAASRVSVCNELARLCRAHADHVEVTTAGVYINVRIEGELVASYRTLNQI